VEANSTGGQGSRRAVEPGGGSGGEYGTATLSLHLGHQSVRRFVLEERRHYLHGYEILKARLSTAVLFQRDYER
jgi:hypothetical protein